MEDNKKPQNKKMIIWIILILIVIFLAGFFLYDKSLSSNLKPEYGVTFSPEYATKFGLDWRSTYIQILDDLKVKKARIPTYWDIVEPTAGAFDFSDSDFMVSEMQKRDGKVLLVVGYKQPRWPECHAPQWAQDLSLEDRQKALFNYIQTTVLRYKDNPEIWAWQVENEPLFNFGDSCDKISPDFLKQEVNLVRSLDPGREIVITDTGEWSSWITSMRLSDILGISLYYQAYNPVLGYTYYPFPAAFYKLKYAIVKKLFAPQNTQQIVAELQAEAWMKEDLSTAPIDEQVKAFPVSTLKSSLDLAKKTQDDSIYFWGVEWWYFMAEHNHPEYLNYIKSQI